MICCRPRMARLRTVLTGLDPFDDAFLVGFGAEQHDVPRCHDVPLHQ